MTSLCGSNSVELPTLPPGLIFVWTALRASSTLVCTFMALYGTLGLNSPVLRSGFNPAFLLKKCFYFESIKAFLSNGLLNGLKKVALVDLSLSRFFSISLSLKKSPFDDTLILFWVNDLLPETN